MVEEYIARLLDLQECDRKIDRLKDDLRSIPREMEIHEKELRSHEAKYEEFVKRLDDIRKKQKKLAGDRATNDARIADSKSKLVTLKSNSEYSAMLNQIAHLKEINDKIDSMILEAMYEEDEVIETIETARKERDRSVKRSELRTEALRRRLQETEKKLAEAEESRKAIAAGVDRKQLKMYETARRRGRREVVVGVVNGACGGCLTKIPPQSAVEIKAGGTFSCPICGSHVVWTSDSSL